MALCFFNEVQSNTALRTPRYYGQFHLSLGKARHTFYLNSARLIRTPVNLMRTTDACFLPNQPILNYDPLRAF